MNTTTTATPTVTRRRSVHVQAELGELAEAISVALDQMEARGHSRAWTLAYVDGAVVLGATHYSCRDSNLFEQAALPLDMIDGILAGYELAASW